MSDVYLSSLQNSAEYAIAAYGMEISLRGDAFDIRSLWKQMTKMPGTELAGLEVREDGHGEGMRGKDVLASVPKVSAPATTCETWKTPLHGLASERRPGVTEAGRRLETSLFLSGKIAIKTKGKILFICPAGVSAVEAQGNYVLLQRQSDSYLLKESISAIAVKLSQFGFVRIHRSVVVNRAWVEEIRPWIAGEYMLRIKGGREYKVSRTYRRNLKELAQSWIGTDSFVE